MTDPKRQKNKYSPIGVNKDGERMAPPAEKIKQSSKSNFETPQMSRPEPYKKPRRGKTDS